MMRAMPVFLLLAACSASQADYNQVEVRPKEAEADAMIANAAGEKGPRALALEGVPVSTPTPRAGGDNTLPATFQGYWGIRPTDCELANVNATGRVNIDGATVRFFESRAQIGNANALSPFEYEVALQFSGEGRRWTRVDRLKLGAGGTRLVRQEIVPGQPQPQTTTYQRC